jgi:transcriptional regulator with XRE-family HTH domain
MPSLEKAADIGRRRARRALIRIGDELLFARQQHGLSQASVGKAVRISRSQVSRVERGIVPYLSLDLAARLMAVVGLELAVHAYPTGQPLRDAGHLALIRRFEKLVPSIAKLSHEVPLPGAGEMRAWDEWLEIADERVAVEFETQRRDVQALLRGLASKMRDDPRIGRVVLVLANTRHNRRLMDEFGDLLRPRFRDCRRGS